LRQPLAVHFCRDQAGQQVIARRCFPLLYHLRAV